MPDRNQNPVVEFKSPSAKALADLTAVVQDLVGVGETCRRLFLQLESGDSDPVLLESLWTAALVRYVRCFSHGKRQGLSLSLLDRIPGDPRAFHEYIKNLRDKHIAHSVNPYEQTAVGVVLSPEASGAHQVVGVAKLSMRLLTPEQETVASLARLAAGLRQEVSGMVKDLEERVLEEARAASLDELYARPKMRLVAPDPEKSGSPRE